MFEGKEWKGKVKGEQRKGVGARGRGGRTTAEEDTMEDLSPFSIPFSMLVFLCSSLPGRPQRGGSSPCPRRRALHQGHSCYASSYVLPQGLKVVDKGRGRDRGGRVKVVSWQQTKHKANHKSDKEHKYSLKEKISPSTTVMIPSTPPSSFFSTHAHPLARKHNKHPIHATRAHKPHTKSLSFDKHGQVSQKRTKRGRKIDAKQ